MKPTTLASLFALMCISSTAWACGGDEQMALLGLIVAPFMAIPFTLFGTTVIASQASQWFRRPLWGWAVGTVGAWLACTLGGAAGFALAQLSVEAGRSSNLQSALILSSPLVFEIAYLMWLHSRRPVL